MNRSKAVALITVLFGVSLMPVLHTGNTSAARQDTLFKNAWMYGGNGFESVYDLIMDSTGAVIAYGTYEEATDFNRGGTPDIKTPYDNDAYVTKRNADGSYAWTKTFGISGVYDGYNAIATDSQDNVYVIGSFTGTYNFNPGGTADNQTSNGDYDMFITKYTSAGAYVWTRTIGGTGTEYAADIALDSQDNIYLTGTFTNTVNFNPGGSADNKSSVGMNDGFLTKINANGSYGWTKAFGGTQDDNADKLFVTSDDGVYVKTYYYGTPDFDPTAGSDTRTSKGQYDVAFSKYSSAGTYLWTKTYGTTGYDYMPRTVLDAQDNLYFAGGFSGTLNFNNEGTADNKTATGNDAFITRFNVNGTYGWTTTFGGAGTEYVNYITIDNNGALVVAGGFNGSVDFNGATAGGVRAPVGGYDGYVAKFTTAGVNTWANSFGGANYEDLSGLALDSQGNPYVTGSFESGSMSLMTGSGQTIQLVNDDTSAHYQAHYLIGLSSDGSFTSGTVTAFNNSYAFTENPIISADDKLYFTGRIDYQDTITFDPHGSGITYTLPNDADAFIVKYDLATYHLVTGLSLGLGVTSATDATIDVVQDGIQSTPSASLRLTTDTGVPLAQVITNMTADRAWNSVTGVSDSTAGKSYVHNLVAQPGAGSSYSLYVPKLSGHTAVYVCPGASSLSAVAQGCSGGYTLTLAKKQITETTVGGKTYFVVPNLTGTGGMSISGAELANTGINAFVVPSTAVMLIGGAGILLRKRRSLR